MWGWSGGPRILYSRSWNFLRDQNIQDVPRHAPGGFSPYSSPSHSFSCYFSGKEFYLCFKAKIWGPVESSGGEMGQEDFSKEAGWGIGRRWGPWRHFCLTLMGNIAPVVFPDSWGETGMVAFLIRVISIQ